MTEISCQSISPLISAYYDGELPDEQKTIVRTHSQRCPRCAAELIAFEAITKSLSFSQPSPGDVPAWATVETELFASQISASSPRRSATWFRQSPIAAFCISTAASTILLVGLGLMATSNQSMSNTGAEQHAMHSLHEHNHPMTAEHGQQFAVVMNDYLQTLPTNPDRAEEILNTTYPSKLVDNESAVRLVGYRPIVYREPPDGYSIASTRVMAMPCCTCVKAVCKRNDGSTLVLFEHDDEQPAWFGERSGTMATCGDKDCCLVTLDSNIAATWKQGSRSVTAVGVKDKNEVATLVEWLSRN